VSPRTSSITSAHSRARRSSPASAAKRSSVALGLLLSLPMLRRLHRRFRTLVAPALAVVAFAAVFSFSSLVVAPRLTGSEKAPAAPGIQQPDNHASHHSGAGSK